MNYLLRLGMKTSFCIMAICAFVITETYANQGSSSYNIRTVKIEPQNHQPIFKISERVVLKKQQKQKQEVEDEEQVSNFSMEELRVGAQRVPDKSEIQYFKSQCRYAFMSDKDIIENRCNAKKVSIAK